LLAGTSLTSLGIDGLPRALISASYSSAGQMGNLIVGVNGRGRQRLYPPHQRSSAAD
jgi:hypothetical protein